MMFETMHVLHISEVTHEITSDCYSEYTGYQYGSQEELSYVQIGENNSELGKGAFPIEGLLWGNGGTAVKWNEYKYINIAGSL